MASRDLELKIVASSLEGSGDARLCAENMEYLGVGAGEEIEVLKGKYSVLLDVLEDTIYEPEAIRLKAEDIFLVGAREGDMVIVQRPGEIKPEAPKEKAVKPAKKRKRSKRKKRSSKKRKKSSKKKGKK